MDEALKENMMGALENVIDPELGIDIVNIGLVYDVDLNEDGLATVTMTLTSMGCPLAGHIEADVRRALSDIPEVKDIKVRSEEHTSELQSRGHLVCRLLLEKKNT